MTVAAVFKCINFNVNACIIANRLRNKTDSDIQEILKTTFAQLQEYFVCLVLPSAEDAHLMPKWEGERVASSGISVLVPQTFQLGDNMATWGVRSNSLIVTAKEKATEKVAVIGLALVNSKEKILDLSFADIEMFQESFMSKIKDPDQLTQIVLAVPSNLLKSIYR